MYIAVASEPTARLTSILPVFSAPKTLIFAMTARLSRGIVEHAD
jgi:hypothetical protein